MSLLESRLHIMINRKTRIIRKAFHFYDVNHDGVIDFEEFISKVMPSDFLDR